MQFINETPTPLSTMFFSKYNIDLLQRAIRQSVLNTTGYAIDYQNHRDVIAIMRVAYFSNASQQYGNVPDQMKLMNASVIQTATSQIQTNLAQYAYYMKTLGKQPTLPSLPVNTSVYGKKIGI